MFQDINPTEFLEQQETLYLVTRPFLKAQRAIENLLSMGGHYCSFHSAASLRVRLRQSLAVGAAISITLQRVLIRKTPAIRSGACFFLAGGRGLGGVAKQERALSEYQVSVAEQTRDHGLDTRLRPARIDHVFRPDQD